MDKYSELVHGIKDTCDMLYCGNYIDIYYNIDGEFYMVYAVTPDTVLSAGFNKEIVTDGVCLKYNVMSILFVIKSLPNEVRLEANELLTWISKAHILGFAVDYSNIVGKFIRPINMMNGETIRMNRIVISRRIPLDGSAFTNPVWGIDPKALHVIDTYLHNEDRAQVCFNSKV